MRFQSSNAFVSAGIAIVLISAGTAHAARIPRIELLRAASVASTQVLLSDLLPANAPGSLRALAGEISLGAAPQAGNTRILVRDSVERDASASQEVLSKVSVPERMVVSRAARPITSAEVLAAILAALRESGTSAAVALHPEDISLQSQVLVSPGDAGLRVIRMDLDRELGRARFLLWPSRDPKVLPFVVTARLGTDSLPDSVRFIPGVRQSRKDFAHTTASAPPEKKEILVAQGEQASLTLQSAALRIFVGVVPLEHGTLGQQIRVRMLDSGKILTARVDGRSHLESKF